MTDIEIIHLDTGTVYPDDYAAYKAVYREQTGKAEPMTPELLASINCRPFRHPVYDSATHKQTEAPVEIMAGDPPVGTGVWTWQVMAKTAEEIADEIKSQCRQIEIARRAFLDEQIDPDGIQLAMMLYQAGHPYGVEMFAWFVELGKEMSLRRAQLEAGVVEFGPELLDFSSVGDKPLTVNEMMIAAGV